MQVNQPQGGTVEATTAPLAVGAKVSYVAMSGGCWEYRLSARIGVTVGIVGNVATLRAAQEVPL